MKNTGEAGERYEKNLRSRSRGLRSFSRSAFAISPWPGFWEISWIRFFLSLMIPVYIYIYIGFLFNSINLIKLCATLLTNVLLRGGFVISSIKDRRGRKSEKVEVKSDTTWYKYFVDFGEKSRLY